MTLLIYDLRGKNLKEHRAASFRCAGRFLCLQCRDDASELDMTDTDFSTVCNEFTDALTEVLAENAVGLARRGRLARARAAVKKHPDYTEHAYFLAVETAFKNWEAMQNVGH
jgi:hypothetical protein